VVSQQLAQRAQPLQLAGSVEPVAGRRALWLDEARTLDVAQHAGRPAGDLGSLVDGQGVLHVPQPYHGYVKVVDARPVPARPASQPVASMIDLRFLPFCS
jgi:hypothetical protein